MELVTGRKGTAHITSQEDRMKHQGTWGSGAYILQTGQMLEPQVQSSNEIRIRDGALMVQGALSTVKVNSYDPVTIQNGSQGMKRIDLICWQYTYDAEQDVESAEWVVIQGTPAESDPQQPAYTDGDIQQGDSPVQVPVFAVELDGINVTGVTTMLPTAPTIEELNSNKPEEGNGYLKYPDGTLIQWGRAIFPALDDGGTGYAVITFPIAFVGDPIITATDVYANSVIVFDVSVQPIPGGKSANLYARTNTGAPVTAATAFWHAIGTWK